MLPRILALAVSLTFALPGLAQQVGSQTPASAAASAEPAASPVAPAPVAAVAVASPEPVIVAAPVATPVPAVAPAPVTVVPTVAPVFTPYTSPFPAPAFQPATQVYTPVMVSPMPAMPTNPWMQYAPPPTFGYNPMMMMGGQAGAPAGKLPPYTMRRAIHQDEKRQLMGMALPMMTGMMGMQMPDSMNYFAYKVKAKKGLSFDEVRDSLFLRANQLNVKKVGENLMWKDFHVVLEDKDAPRIEVYSFCDIAVGRELLKISPEFIVFLPCRIAVMEDANKDIWVLMIDWNPDWVVGYRERLGISDALWDGARDLYKRLTNMIDAAASGDL